MSITVREINKSKAVTLRERKKERERERELIQLWLMNSSTGIVSRINKGNDYVMIMDCGNGV